MIIPSKIGGVVSIGYEGENNAREYRFDISRYQQAWPESTPQMLVTRSDGENYIAETSVEGTELVWVIKRSDLACPGQGSMIIAFIDDQKDLVSYTETTILSIEETMEWINEEKPPDPAEPWVAAVLKAGAAATSAAEQARKSAESAENAAATSNAPKIIGGNWYVWNMQSGTYVDTGISATGTSLVIKALYASLDALVEAHPTGEAGDAYAVGTSESNTIYLWDEDNGEWADVGELKGPPGAVGPQGPKGDGLYAFDVDGDGHLICTYDTQNPPPLSINSGGHLIYTLDGGKQIDLGKVAGETAGYIETDDTLTYENGVLSVNTASEVTQDNTLPITSAAVHTTVGNIEILLATI